MTKSNSIIYICDNCGGEHSQWEGRCRFCQSWNTLKEFKYEAISKGEQAQSLKPEIFTDLPEVDFKRLETNIEEFDRVLGGGMVSGSVILLGGDPGIGKSTLLLQVCASIANQQNGSQQKVIYVSGEESLSQLKLRARRLKLDHSPIQVLNETNLPNIVKTIEGEKPDILVIDSIQTLFHPDFPSTPGSIVQVRECSLRLQQVAKKGKVIIILVGHITKEGVVAGPKTLEHLVDVVLYLEGEKYHNIRILRGVKNRFGNISESGIFEMVEEGFKEIKNPSDIFLSEKISAPGSIITATLEGRRPILIEIQTLVKKTTFGYPKRTASGYDLNRLQLLIAVLEKRTGISLDSYDVYINIVGGLKIKEPAADLAIICALASAKNNIVIDDNLVIWGEVGLVGEIRRTLLEKDREKETERLGYHYTSKTKTIQEFLVNLSLNKI